MIGGLLLAAVLVGTWNGNWFPSGRAEHRAHPDVEAATISSSARMLREGIQSLDPTGSNDVILCLHEMRGPHAAEELVRQIGRSGLRVVSVSGYRRRDRFDMQQDVIATTLPVVGSGWEKFAPQGRETPPRGYSYATVVVSEGTTGTVYAVHLKSNYGAKTAEANELNRLKRTHSIVQILGDLSARRAQVAIVAGDFNADKWRKEFAAEKIFDLLENAGFDNVLARLPPDCRGTHPSRRHGDSALDYIMARGLTPVGNPRLIPNEALSDHYALFAVLKSQK